MFEKLKVEVEMFTGPVKFMGHEIDVRDPYGCDFANMPGGALMDIEERWADYEFIAIQWGQLVIDGNHAGFIMELNQGYWEVVLNKDGMFIELPGGPIEDVIHAAIGVICPGAK